MVHPLKNNAIKLRKQGFSYSEILKEIPVAKSTLSLWLRSVNLSKKQYQTLTKKRIEAQKKGSEARRRMRIENTHAIREAALAEMNEIDIDNQNLLLMGTMLYWAEGSKQKNHLVSQGVIFSNSDPMMTKLFLLWLKRCLEIPDDQIVFEIYIHEKHRYRSKEVAEYWSCITAHSQQKFDKIYYKKHDLKTNRKIQVDTYFGLLRVRVKRSTNLNRKIAGLIEGICRKCGVV